VLLVVYARFVCELAAGAVTAAVVVQLQMNMGSGACEWLNTSTYAGLEEQAGPCRHVQGPGALGTKVPTGGPPVSCYVTTTTTTAVSFDVCDNLYCCSVDVCDHRYLVSCSAWLACGSMWRACAGTSGAGAEVPTVAECITADASLLLFKMLFVNICKESGACRLPVGSAVLRGWQAQGPAALGIAALPGRVPLLLLLPWLLVGHL
jgi:hypothetical protein